MRKLYSSIRYNKWKSTSAAKSLRAKKHRASRKKKYKDDIYNADRTWENQRTIKAPIDFRIIENTNECLAFFREVRNKENHYYYKGRYYVKLDLSRIEQVDYSSASILKAILFEFKTKDIYVQGDVPLNQDCNNFLMNSGFFDELLDLKNNPINLKSNSDRIKFTKGSGRLTSDEDIAITTILKKIREYLTGEKGHCPQLRTIILEICGNSIEHSDSYNKQWIFGVKYEEEKVVITLTDIGKGILVTLYRKLEQKISDLLKKDRIQILSGAFDKKYTSKTLDVNRNKGLPAIKNKLEQGYIKNLVVITNDVMLDFQNLENSKVFTKGSARFYGTFFKWELDKNCFKKIVA